MSDCVDTVRQDWTTVAYGNRGRGRAGLAKLSGGIFSYPCTGKYATCFHTFIEALRDATFDKLVLSRSLTIGKNPEFSPSAVFRAACQRYIHSYIYLCYTPQTGVWLGSTPEIILSGEKMNGTQLPWQELNLCRMVNFRKYGMTKTVRSRIMWRPISVGSFFRWAFAPQRADLIRLMPVPCHI